MLVLSKQGGRGHTHLLVRPRDAHKELWDGPRAGVEGALAHFGPDAADELDQLPRVLAKLLAANPALFVPSAPPPPQLPDQILRVLHGVGSTQS